MMIAEGILTGYKIITNLFLFLVQIIWPFKGNSLYIRVHRYGKKLNVHPPNILSRGCPVVILCAGSRPDQWRIQDFPRGGAPTLGWGAGIRIY